MMRSARILWVFTLSLTAALAACQDDGPTADAPPTSASEAPSGAVSTPAGPNPSGASADPATEATADVFDWSKIDIPAMEATYKPGDKVWAVTALPGNAQAVQILPAAVVESQGNDVSLRVGTRKTTVPASMTRPRSAVAAIENGTPVLAGNFFAANYARVVASAANVTVDVSLPGRVTRRDIVRDSVLPLDGTLAFAAPVHFKDGDVERVGILVYKGADKSYVADATRFMKEVPTAALEPVPLDRILKKGEKVRALSGTTLLEGTVEDVVGDGVLYRLGGPNKESFSKVGVSFTQVVAAAP